LVNFGELLGKTKTKKSTDPLEIFKNLDKLPGKEYLWPPQEAVLREWNLNHRNKKDTIVKLHTGQGKTLIGLLMLQSCINEGNGPALYVCPNNYLVDQIIKEAQSYDIKTVKFDGGPIPQSFRNSEAILVCNCNKLFNGKSVFGVRGTLGKEIVQIGSIVIDDAHKCLEIIRIFHYFC
jgi:replicative superfamily II helicase